ncbi:hypothetical protein [Bifidobacterium felsineum]|uniref:hypothetical protein n=1 Tax=Bifidobacterium felsineum TaxID=2045440 RepID=UPI001BDDB7C1|nr:hypothetical protein [Bifidobacterium felsineum]MBT1164617.1 hypothetical protein [Bifidobacterium felsineum]
MTDQIIKTATVHHADLYWEPSIRRPRIILSFDLEDTILMVDGINPLRLPMLMRAFGLPEGAALRCLDGRQVTAEDGERFRP